MKSSISFILFVSLTIAIKASSDSVIQIEDYTDFFKIWDKYNGLLKNEIGESELLT